MGDRRFKRLMALATGLAVLAVLLWASFARAGQRDSEIRKEIAMSLQQRRCMELSLFEKKELEEYFKPIFESGLIRDRWVCGLLKSLPENLRNDVEVLHITSLLRQKPMIRIRIDVSGTVMEIFPDGDILCYR